MITEQRIKTTLPFKYESVPVVLIIGNKTLIVAGTTYYRIDASTTEEYVPPFLLTPMTHITHITPTTPTIEDTREVWGSGYMDLYSTVRQVPYGEPAGIEEPTHTEIERDFYALAQQWKRECTRGADISEMAMHPSYQRIIGMGPDVVPLLLKELEREPEHWFWALYSITGVNPVPPEGEGKLKEMAKAWVDWGKRQGYRW